MTHARPIIPSKTEIAALPPDGGDKWNRLIFEQSPYLQQHAANPVDWWPWNDAAFAEAKRLDKPVFLSVGYSTCHWCHVMEHESFEDAEVARLMNDAFINIKVDREERPDIDQVYMAVTQAMTGSGGWPMTIIMTPEKRPFFAGTYYPKNSRGGRPGMIDLVPYIENAWKTDRDKIDESADGIAAALKQMSGGSPGGELTSGTLTLAFEQYGDRYDPRKGGFGDRPKFPVPHNYMLLMRYYHRTGDVKALDMVKKSLLEMRLGGIYDQVGYGFHRYSTDSDWLVPHFEKMLYDQALLAMAYTEAYKLTGDTLFRQTAREIYTYILRDMTDEGGGFYSAEDADSEGEEGKFYVWSEDELREILGEDDTNLFARTYNFDEEGNFREESTGQLMGTNIPHLSKPLDGMAEKRIEPLRQRLFDVRERRVHPFKDDKILTDWNGLMIAAMAYSANAFDDDRYRTAAKRAADFVLENLQDDSGRLMKRYRNGDAGLPAHLEDYAFFSWGLIELYEATFDAKYLAEADRLTRDMIEHFYDEEGGGFFLTADDGEELLVRAKEAYDGAIPSGNSVAALVLLKLGRMTGNTDYEERAAATLAAFSGTTGKMPSQFAVMSMAADFEIGPSHEIVLAGDDVDAMARAVFSQYLPNAVVLHRPENGDAPIVKLAPFLEYNTSIDGKATAYVCRNYACKQPVTTIEELKANLPPATPAK